MSSKIEKCLPILYVMHLCAFFFSKIVLVINLMRQITNLMRLNLKLISKRICIISGSNVKFIKFKC